MSRENNQQGFLKPSSAVIFPLYNVETANMILARLDSRDSTGEIYIENLIMKQYTPAQEVMLFDIPNLSYDFTVTNANTAYGVPGYFPSTGASPVESISGRTCAVTSGPLVAGNFSTGRFSGKYFVVGNNQQVTDSPVAAPTITAQENSGLGWSLSFWILRQNNSAASNVYGEENSPGFAQAFRVILNTNGTLTLFHVGGGSPGSAYTTPVGSAVGLFAWHHCVFTYDGTNIRFYLDGSLSAGPTAYTRNTGLTTNLVALNLTALGQQQLQNVAVYPNVLTAGQISRQWLDLTTTVMGDNGTLILDAYSGGVLTQGGTIGQGWTGYIMWTNALMPAHTTPGLGVDAFSLPVVGVAHIRNLSSTAEYVYELKIHEKESVD